MYMFMNSYICMYVVHTYACIDVNTSLDTVQTRQLAARDTKERARLGWLYFGREILS